MATWQRWLVPGMVAALMAVAGSPVLAATEVAGMSNPKLAGMPAGSTAGDGDVAPAQSPVLVSGLALQAGQWLQFSATGAVDHCGGGCSGITPDGTVLWSNSAENGISGIQAPINALLGVFLGAAQPNLGVAPAALDFGDAALGTSFSSLAPALQQVFFIGDGRTAGGAVQQFQVPVGATRLYLAVHDGYGWYNNTGVILASVSAVPEPAAWALMLTGVAALVLGAGRRHARS